MKNKKINPEMKYLALWGWSSILFSVFLAFPHAMENGISSLPSWFFRDLVIGMAVSVPLSGAVWLIRTCRTQILRFQNKEMKSGTLFWIVLIGLCLIWMIPFLAYFPGIFGADAPLQSAMMLGIRPLSNHHPLLHTIIFGGLLRLSLQVFGTAQAGLAIYILVFQILFTAYALARAMLSLHQRKVPAWILLLMTLILAVNPIVMVLVCYTTKDIPFAAALLLFVVSLSELLIPIQKKQGRADLKACSIRTFVWGLLMGLLRSQGVYMAFGALILLLFQYRNHLKSRRFRIAEGIQTLIVAVCLLISSGLPALGLVQKVDFREAIHVPIQQMASVLRADALSETPLMTEQLRNDALYYFDEFENEPFDAQEVDSYSADYAKYHFITARMKENPLQFLKTWYRLLRTDFSAAADSTIWLTAPYFNMTYSPHNALITHEEQELEGSRLDISSHSLLPGVRSWLNNTVSETSDRENCPFWLRLFDPAISLFLLLFLLGYTLIFRNRLISLVLIYPLLYALTMLLGPVALLRYSYIYLMEWPFLFGALLVPASESSRQSVSDRTDRQLSGNAAPMAE